MKFETFTELLHHAVAEKMGKEYSVCVTRVRKNNGVVLTGLAARRRDSLVSPTAYIDNFFEKGMKEQEVEKAAEMICRQFQETVPADRIDLSEFLDFEKAKKNLAFKLINREKNEELLKTMPYRPVFDLAMVYYYTLKDEIFGKNAAIMVGNSHLEHWQVDAGTLHEAAYGNAPALFPAIVEDIEKMAGGLAGDRKESPSLYVLTNRQNLQGAACMLYPDVLENFGEKIQNSFFVLPSSVHEVILVPDTGYMDQEALHHIVADINRTQVAREEVLADSVYYFDRKKRRLERLNGGISGV